MKDKQKDPYPFFYGPLGRQIDWLFDHVWHPFFRRFFR